ncbi:MAG: hypothetical protein K2H70_06375, partial [Bacteroidales bacterium]|nr:hypothetical protein [Bacteroidales bacterium]
LILKDLQARYGQTAPAEKGITESTAADIAGLFKERVCFPTEITDWAAMLYVRPDRYTENGLKKFDKPENREALRQVLDFMKQQSAGPWAGAGAGMGVGRSAGVGSIMENDTLAFIREKGYPMGQVMSLFRLALTGDAQGPNVFPLVAFMGMDEAAARTEALLNKTL